MVLWPKIAPLWCLLSAAGCQGDATVTTELGAACADDGDCAARCLAPSDEFPGGFCTRGCVRDADCSSSAICVELEDGGACLFLCRDGGDCGFLDTEGSRTWTCDERDGITGERVLACVGN